MSTPSPGVLDGLETDARGYLVNRGDWSREVAAALAAQDDLALTAAHWEIIDFVQRYHDEFADAPPMRVLVRAIAARLGKEKGNTRYLYRLFPEGPAKQVCRYAGLPKPTSCV